MAVGAQTYSSELKHCTVLGSQPGETYRIGYLKCSRSICSPQDERFNMPQDYPEGFRSRHRRRVVSVFVCVGFARACPEGLRLEEYRILQLW
jgi:hypothetical protein